jgi:hypothetical protein
VTAGIIETASRWTAQDTNLVSHEGLFSTSRKYPRADPPNAKLAQALARPNLRRPLALQQRDGRLLRPITKSAACDPSWH